MYADVSEAQKAIRTFHDSNDVFTGHGMSSRKPLFVDFWLSRQEIEAERRQKTETDMHRLLKTIFTQT